MTAMPRAVPTAGRATRVLTAIGIVLAAAVLAFGLYSEDWASLPWAATAIGVFGLPLVAQSSRRATWRMNGLWFGLFVVAQALLTPMVKGDYVTLPPNMKSTVDVVTDGIPGYPRGLRRIGTDERGWRVQPPVDYRHKTGLRILAIGGSTTEDIMLDDRATWTHLLQLRVAEWAPDGAHVINTGVSGLRALNHVATLEKVAALKPDLVLVLLGGNDWNREIKNRFEPDRGRWVPLPFRQTALPQALDATVITPLRRKLGGQAWADASSRVAGVRDMVNNRRSYTERRPLYRFTPKQPAEDYRRDLDRLADLCDRHQMACMLMTQPHAYRPGSLPAELEATLWMTPPFADYGLELASMAHVAQLYNGYLLGFAARRNLASCDLAADMPPDPQLFYDDMHYTDEGARRVAGIVSRCVEPVVRALVAGQPIPTAARP